MPPVYILNILSNVWGREYRQTGCMSGLLLSELLCHVHGTLRRVASLAAHPNHYKITFAIAYTASVAHGYVFGI